MKKYINKKKAQNLVTKKKKKNKKIHIFTEASATSLVDCTRRVGTLYVREI